MTRSRADHSRDLDDCAGRSNAGEANVRSYGGIPPFAETQNCVLRVLARYDAFRSRSTQ
ncbi:hypothetical protein SAMN06265784_10960 [Paraburkholderia susongensis]|uniref:Uncharacterized protein n=1 Tax=Paraburkholderia susongensis TaxID=1515439 RepID=A0A1X7LU72_9BURK|nr:hypothetical protein SAMN06265784_10960 [Paraburkholderia susongensis]